MAASSCGWCKLMHVVLWQARAVEAGDCTVELWQGVE